MQYYLYTQFLPTLGDSSGTNALLANGHILLTICNHPAAFKAATKDIPEKTLTKATTKSSPSISPLVASGGQGQINLIPDDSDEEPAQSMIVEALR